MQEEIPPAPEERSEPEEPEQPLVNGTLDETGHTTPTKPKGVTEQPNSPDLDHASEVNDNPNAEPAVQDPTSSKVGDQDTDNANPNLLLSNSKTEAAQQSLWFETQLNSTEMDFLQKLLPKGYSLTTQFRASRARAARNVDPSQTIDFKDDPLPKRPPRIHSNRFRPAEISYGPPKYSKNVSDLVKKCFKVLSQLQKHQYSRPFLKPVDPDAEGIPDYFDIVKEPMDLSKVDKRLRSGSYVNPMQFAADVRKIWSNAILYNPRKSAIYRMTVQISDFFEQIYKPVEENPFAEPPNEYLLSRVLKIEQKLDEIKNGYSNPEEYLNRPMRLDDKLKLAKALKSSLQLTKTWTPRVSSVCATSSLRICRVSRNSASSRWIWTNWRLVCCEDWRDL